MCPGVIVTAMTENFKDKIYDSIHAALSIKEISDFEKKVPKQTTDHVALRKISGNFRKYDVILNTLR